MKMKTCMGMIHINIRYKREEEQKEVIRFSHTSLTLYFFLKTKNGCNFYIAHVLNMSLSTPQRDIYNFYHFTVSVAQLWNVYT